MTSFGSPFVFAYVTLAWLLFQLPDFGDAIRYLQAIGENTAHYIRLDRLLVLGIYCLPVVLYHLHGYMRERRPGAGEEKLKTEMLKAENSPVGPGLVPVPQPSPESPQNNFFDQSDPGTETTHFAKASRVKSSGPTSCPSPNSHTSAVALAKEDIPSPISAPKAFLYNAAYGGMLFWILFNSGSSSEFIYFQF